MILTAAAILVTLVWLNCWAVRLPSPRQLRDELIHEARRRRSQSA